ncbi:LolA family protein [Aquirufa sp. A-Brett2-15D]
MKKVILFFCLSFSVFAQSNKAVSLIDGMQKKYKAMGSFSANFTYQTDGAATMSGSITVKGTKFRLKTAGQEIFNNGKEVATYIKEINEVNISSFDPSEGDLNPAKIYSFDKKSYKISLKGESAGISTVELAPVAKGTQVKSIALKIKTKDLSVTEWTIINKAGKKQLFKVSKLNAKVNADDKVFNFDKKTFPGVEVNDLR